MSVLRFQLPKVREGANRKPFNGKLYTRSICLCLIDSHSLGGRIGSFCGYHGKESSQAA